MENLSEETKSTILIVDDVPSNLKIVSNVLGDKYKVMLAHNADRALLILEKYRVDLILLDVIMPDVDGFSLCKKIKLNSMWSEIPIIFLTAKKDPEEIVKGFSLGCVDYITKPFNVVEVKVRIETHLRLIDSKNDLKKLISDLEKSNQEKDKLFTIISHDLKTSLFGAREGLKLILKNWNQPEEQKKRTIQSVYDNVEFSSNLMVNLLEWAKMQISSITINPESFQIKAIISEILNTYKEKIAYKGIHIKETINSNYSIFTDKTLFISIIENLFTNALKYTGKNGRIEIDSQENLEYYIIIIKDNGIGISEEIQSDLFRLSISHSKQGTDGEMGSGMGLAICSELILKLEGRIEVDSMPGLGSKFMVYFPKNSPKN